MKTVSKKGTPSLSNRIKIVAVLFTTAASLFAGSLKAQQKVFSYTEVGYYAGLNKVVFDKTMYAVSLRTMVGTFVTPKTALAIGIGLDGYHTTGESDGPYANTFPIFVDGRYFFKEVNSPYINANAGYSLKLSDNFSKGFLAGVGAGYRFKIGSKSALNAGVKYNYQSIQLGYGYSTDISTIGLNVGFRL